MIEIRDKISNETMDMSFEELKKFKKTPTTPIYLPGFQIPLVQAILLMITHALFLPAESIICLQFNLPLEEPIMVPTKTLLPSGLQKSF